MMRVVPNYTCVLPVLRMTFTLSNPLMRTLIQKIDRTQKNPWNEPEKKNTKLAKNYGSFIHYVVSLWWDG